MKLEDVYQVAVQQAESDGIITKEERQLLDQLRFEIDRSENRIQTKSLDLTDHLHQLDAVKSRIIQNTIAVVLEDGVISEGERNILKSVSDSLDTYYP